MAVENDFLPFADGGGANVISQSAYVGLSNLTTGFAAGIAASNVANKVWRQSSLWTYFLSQFVVNETGLAALDNGDLVTPLTNLTSAIGIAAKAAVSAQVPQTTNLTSGSGTYTTPVGAAYLEIEMGGGGSGGGGGGTTTTGGPGGSGGNTTFGTFTANGGSATPTSSVTSYPSPASGSGAGAQIFTGALGAPSSETGTNFAGTTGGTGAGSMYGGGAPGAVGLTGLSTNPISATAFCAGGGGGAGLVNASYSGWGGNSGAVLRVIIAAPVATYSYSVGSGGTAGSAGTSGNAGSAGASGIIRIIARFQ